MVLAAGRGERMRPLTDRVPKPLLPVGGQPLIVRLLERLAAGGVEHVAINTSWLGEQLHAALGDGRRFGLAIEWFDEGPVPLETAGGIRNALAAFGEEPFAVINGDLYCDLPLPPPAPAPDRLAHLVLVPNPPQHPRGDFGLECGELRPEGAPRYTYAGIASFRPALFRALPPGRRALRPVLDQAAHAGLVTAQLHAGRWVDVGTPERLAALDASLA
ncbi:MAG: nucleotidyltransferase family protein [Proteobacteria bacterium]|nr:nucleotidyltransferase family protein [Pseudomonadota bacterium]